MLSDTISNFKQLRTPVKSLVYLFWTYAFTGSLIGVFLQIFLYERFSDITLNIYSTMIFYTGIMVGFVVLGYLASLWRLNIKNGFIASFFITAMSIVLLSQAESVSGAYWAMFFNGMGSGLFWLTIHTFELSETKNKERDFYSSMLTAGSQIFTLAGPALATLLIWISESILSWDTFALLFMVTPLFYLLGLFCFADIEDYRPEPVRLDDLKHFLSEKRNLLSQVYLLGSDIGNIPKDIIIPLATLFILGGALEVGIYNTLFAIFSTFCVLYIAKHRTTDNRLQILGVATVLLAGVTILYGYLFGLVTLIVYTIAYGILSPILRVSVHVIDLETMESIGRKESDFYATMLLRDLSLFVWRILGGFMLLGLLHFFTGERDFIAVGLYLVAFSLLTTFGGAYLLLQSRNTN